jgi:hypothetical protein
MVALLRLLFAAILTLGATADRATVAPGGQVTIRMPVTSPDGAHIELLANDGYVPLAGGIDRGRCVWNGCVTGPGTAVMTETIRIADDAPPGPLTLTALASAADGSYVTATVVLMVADLNPPDPRLTARWAGPGVATVRWSQTERSCLFKQPLIGPAVFLDCYDTPGSYAISFGVVGSLDAAYRPTAGDIYVLQTGGEVWRAPLRSITFLPVSCS